MHFALCFAVLFFSSPVFQSLLFSSFVFNSRTYRLQARMDPDKPAVVPSMDDSICRARLVMRCGMFWVRIWLVYTANVALMRLVVAGHHYFFAPVFPLHTTYRAKLTMCQYVQRTTSKHV